MRSVLYIFSFLFITSILNANAQIGKGKINGKVTDAVTKLPVDYATVSLFKQGSASPFNGISTDAKGNFIIDNVPAGDYKLTVDFLGYTKGVIEHVVVNAGGTAALGNILLKPIQNQLSTVVVTAKAPIIENRIDKMVYNAANDLTAQGGVALDVLKKVPQVSVDIDGNVELQGNANIRFLINGKPSSIFGASLADALQSIPASQIKSIEVVTSPGAKYDAAGTGGIINIILKDSKISGINGSLNGAVGTRQSNGSLNLNARKGSFGANAYFSGNAQRGVTGNSSNDRRGYDLTTGDSTRLLQTGSNTGTRSSYQTGLSLNWSITPKDELTGTFGFNHFGNHNYGFTSQQETQTSSAGMLLSQLLSQRNSDSRFNSNSTDYSLSYKKTFAKEGQELDVLYNTSYSKNTVNYFQEQDYLTGGYPSSGSRGNNPGNDRETNISIDYTHPVTKTFILEGGAKAVIEDLKNTVNTDSLLNNGSYVNNADQTYGFNYKRNIYAVYLSTSASLFSNWLDVKAGIRNEYTTTTANFPGVNIPGYNTVAPSATLSHKLSGAQSIKLSYNYRIERPDYGEVNPFYNISDPHNISTGNPNLKPEVSHGLELGYNKSFDSGANISLGAFYRHNKNDIQSFTTQYEVLNINGRDYTNVLLTQRANIGTQTSIGSNFFGSVPVTSKLNLRTNMFLVSRTNTSAGYGSVTGIGYRVNLNATYQLGNDLTAEGFVNYNSSQRNLQGTRPHFLFYNFAVRKQLFNKKASLGLVAANPFNKYINLRSNTFGPWFNQNSLRQVPLQSFGITLSYKFGKLEFAKEKDKEDRDDKGDNMPLPDAGSR